MKKKKKSIIIRRVRKRSNTKRIIYYHKSFRKLFNVFFNLKKIQKQSSFNKSFVSFLKLFHFSGMHRLYSYIKDFGMPKNYRVIKNSLFFSKHLIFKYGVVIKKKNSLFKLENKILNIKHKEIFLKFRKFWAVKSKNIIRKKRLCLHVSYRHMLLLPVRGQRTKTNAKTRKDFCIT